MRVSWDGCVERNSGGWPLLALAMFCHSSTLWRGSKPARLMRSRFGATDRSSRLRFHTQTGGSTLTAQQPLNNVVRVTIQALAAVLGGTQSLHTNAFDEALALPSEESVLLALRTQQVLAHETGVTNTADPLGGSYFLEALTDELESEADHIESELKERIFASDLEGLDKILLRDLVGRFANICDRAEDVADRVRIIVAKRTA